MNLSYVINVLKEDFILKEELILEKAEDSYIHNCTKEALFKILNSGKIIGSPQNDGATPKLDRSKSRTKEGYIPSKSELCLSRSDYNPQRTGILPTYGFTRGEIIKIQLNMPEITNGKLKIKKPYPVSFGNYSRNRMLMPSVKGLRKIVKQEESIKILDELIKNLDSKMNYQSTLEKKGKWLTQSKFEGAINKVKDLENDSLVSNYIKNKLTDAWYDTGEDTGEERLEMSGKYIPVDSKYITINIPTQMWGDPDIIRYRNMYRNDPKLFRSYKDTSKEAYKRNDYY